jgi:hypothetical protein
MTNTLTVTSQNAIAGQTLTIQPYPSADSSPVVAMLGSKGQESRRKYAESLRTITAGQVCRHPPRDRRPGQRSSGPRPLG